MSGGLSANRRRQRRLRRDAGAIGGARWGGGVVRQCRPAGTEGCDGDVNSRHWTSASYTIVVPMALRSVVSHQWALGINDIVGLVAAAWGTRWHADGTASTGLPSIGAVDAEVAERRR